MTIKKAIEHFKWKFQNKWKPTETDIKAFNTVVEFVNTKHSKQFNDNQLFAKLYIKYYGELIRFYKASVFNKEPQKELNKILDTDLEVLINEFVAIANVTEVFNKMRLSGIEEAHPVLKTREQKNKELSGFNLEILKDEITYDEAVNNLTSMINLSINNFS